MIALATALGQAFHGIVASIRAAVAHHAAATPPLVPILVFVYSRLGRMVVRLDRLAERWRAGTLPRPRPPRPGRAIATRPAGSRPRVPLPQGHAWLIGLVQPTAPFSGQVQVFLGNPETAALVQAAPQAGRILRPLCRMLGIDPPPWLRLPPRPARPAPSRTAPRPDGTPIAAPAGTPPRPLAPWVRATVRHWRSKADMRHWRLKAD